MVIKKFLEMFGDEHEEDDDEVEVEKNVNVKVQKKQVENEKTYENEKKVVTMNMFKGRKEEGVRSKVSSVSIIRPKTFEDARLIADSIKDKKVVTFSLEFLEHETGQRVIDFVGGAVYAMDAHLLKVTDRVLASIPDGVSYEDIDTSLEEDDEL